MAKTPFTKRRLRIAIDCALFTALKDELTSATPTAWKGNTLSVEVGVFTGLNGTVPAEEEQIILLSYESVTMEVKETASSTSNVMAKTVALADMDDDLDIPGWNDGTAQHFAFEFSKTEANIAAGNYHLVFSGIEADGGLVTFGVGQLIVREDGTPTDAADPAENPGSAISMEQADLRYGATGDGLTSKHGAASVASGVETKAVAFTTPFAVAPTTILAQLQGVTADAPIRCDVDASSITTAGFTARLGALTPTASYKLHWIALS